MRKNGGESMKKFLVLAVIVSFLFFPQYSDAQTDPVVKKIIEIGKTDNQTMKHLDVLTNRFGGRPIGSAAYDNAAEWVGRKFKEWGMQVEYDEAGTLAVGFNRGPWFGKMTSPKSKHLHFATPSYSSGTQGRQVGHAVLDPQDDGQFERMKKKLQGAWVLLDPPEVDEEELERRKKLTPEEQDKLREEERKETRAKMKKLEDAGVLGVISSATIPINATYNRDVKEWTSWDDLPTMCDIKLDEHQFAEIKQKIIERQRVELEFDIRNYFKMGPVKYHNVIGIIPGTEYPDEYVIMGGHLDSYDVATGAVDDGSGVTPAMEAARLIMAAGGKPKRTILVCLWAGEEFGILGASHWVEKYESRLPKISNMFNRDGGPTVITGISVSEAMWEDMEKICQSLNDINPDFPFKMVERKPRRKATRLSGTDSSAFSMKGVPTMGFSTADPKGYDFSYREIWHTENDYYQKSIPEYQEHTSIVTAVVVYGIANLDHLLSSEGFYLPDEEPVPKKK
jgi:carboxypeptidase Q